MKKFIIWKNEKYFYFKNEYILIHLDEKFKDIIDINENLNEALLNIKNNLNKKFLTSFNNFLNIIID